MEDAKPKTTLQQLYEIQTIETVHAITDAVLGAAALGADAAAKNRVVMDGTRCWEN